MKAIYILFFLNVLCHGNAQVSDSLIVADNLSPKNYELFLRLNANDKTKSEKINSFLENNQNISRRSVVGNKVYAIIDILNGRPLYVSTDNEQAAISTKTNRLQPNGSLNLNLEGNGVTIGVWDAGPVESSHDEFIIDPSASNPISRVTVIDSGGENDNHATHVTGTIVAKGSDSSAKGMAPKASILSYNWTSDISEVLLAISNNNMILSNHSYGVPLRDDEGNLIDTWLMGNYDSSARLWDELMHNNPNYLMVCSAGNSGTDSYDGGLLDGFDKLTTEKNSKNNLVVANANPQTVIFTGDLTSFPINSGSSQGPTDDLRIKPDIAGDGTNLYSSVTGNLYDTYSGTSMAAPNVTGTLALLQEYYKNLKANYMRSSTLKGLVCHTAIDDVNNSGPDPFFGWGFLNAEEAAKTILKSTTGEAKIIENILNEDQTYTYSFSLTSPADISATLSWTDLPGPSQDNILNSTTKVLINDLDLRISNGQDVFYPWKLTLEENSIDAIKGDNNADNIEKIEINNAPAGNYTLTVTHKGDLQGVGGNPFQQFDQAFSLILSGENLTLSNSLVEKISDAISIYPSPIQNKVLIELSDNHPGDSIDEIFVYNLYGKLLLHNVVENTNKHVVSFENLKSGAYIISVSTSGDILHNKIVLKE